MTTFQIASALNALAIIAGLTATPSQAQPAQTIQAALSKEAGTLSDKFTGMARVMAGKYDWKPGQGVRSVGGVFNLIVMENGILAGTLTGATGGERPARQHPRALERLLRPPPQQHGQPLVPDLEDNAKRLVAETVVRHVPIVGGGGVIRGTPL